MTDGAANATLYARTPSLGGNSDAGSLGDVDVRKNDDGSLTAYVLSANNGAGAYTTTQKSTSSFPIRAVMKSAPGGAHVFSRKVTLVK